VDDLIRHPHIRGVILSHKYVISPRLRAIFQARPAILSREEQPAEYTLRQKQKRVRELYELDFDSPAKAVALLAGNDLKKILDCLPVSDTEKNCKVCHVSLFYAWVFIIVVFTRVGSCRRRS
jgi:hypothetical protein